MDYLPLPSNPMHEPVEVPCISTEEYDGGDLKTYPNRQGWSSRTLREWHHIFQNPPQKFLAFLQTWLFFGPLKLILGDQFRLSDFRCQTNDPSFTGCLITTAQLLPMLKSWVDSGQQRELQRGDDPGAVIDRLIAVPLDLNRKLATEWEPSDFDHVVDQTLTAELALFIEQHSFKDPRDPRIAMSEALMIETLWAALTTDLCCKDTEEYLQAVNGTNTHLHGQKNFLYSRMRNDGWCPAELSMLFQQLNGAAIYFMSHMERPGPTKKHLVAQTPHAYSSPATSVIEASEGPIRSDCLCTEFKCSVYQLHEGTYQTKHTQQCSGGCYNIVADGDEVFDILKSGCIPIIVSIDRDDKARKVKLVKSEPNLDYVAISHVWSDGLGNLQRSALPHCQMLRLSHLVRSLPGKGSRTVHFWIDTIGCPPDVAGQNQAQELAIGMMRKTYEDACAVLVLDSWLEPKVIKHKSEAEILSAIICSAWNSRLWTLQEGALAKTLFFQFADSQYNLDEGIIRLNQSEDLSTELLMKAPINQRVFEFRSFRMTTLRQQNISALISAVAIRSTSVASDKALCLGALLDVDVLQLVQTQPEERMLKLWSLLPEIPAELLFRKYPRLDVEGYRWAPQTLLRHANSSMMLAHISGGESHTAQLSPKGLSVQFSGFIFNTGKHPVGMSFRALDKDGVWYIFDCDVTDAFGRSEYDFEDHSSGKIIKLYSFDPWELHQSEWIAFISSSEDRMEDFGTMTGGLFVSITGCSDGVLYTKVMCRGKYSRVYPSQDEWDKIPQNIHSLAQLPVANVRDGRLSFAPTVAMPSTQLWCLS